MKPRGKFQVTVSRKKQTAAVIEVDPTKRRFATARKTEKKHFDWLIHERRVHRAHFRYLMAGCKLRMPLFMARHKLRDRVWLDITYNPMGSLGVL